MARLRPLKTGLLGLRRLRKSPCKPLKSLAGMSCGSAEVPVQVIEIIAEVLRNVVPPIPPYELPQRVRALRSSFRKGLKRVWL